MSTPDVEPTLGRAPAFVTLTLTDKGMVHLETNIPPEGRPLVHWMLAQASLTVLMTPPVSEKPLITPVSNGGLKGIMKRLHG